jgi:hypothetical protein
MASIGADEMHLGEAIHVWQIQTLAGPIRLERDETETAPSKSAIYPSNAGTTDAAIGIVEDPTSIGFCPFSSHRNTSSKKIISL